MAHMLTPFAITRRDEQELTNLIRSSEFQELLQWDSQFEVADNYLISIALIYLMRAKYTPQQMTYFNLIVALYLAHEVEEEDWINCQVRPDLIRCAFGSSAISEVSFRLFMKKKERLWKALSYNVIVKREESDCIMSLLMRGNGIWSRVRSPSGRYSVRPNGRILCFSADESDGSNPSSCSLMSQ